MSQDFFDSYINKVGETAAKVAAVVKTNKVLREEIANWVVE